MSSKSYAGSLAASLKQEAQAVEERFAKAELAMAPAPTPSRRTRKETKAEERPQPRVARVAEAPSVGRIRDTFSFPPEDHTMIKALRMRCARRGQILSRSEIVRAALHVLHELPDEDVLEVVDRLVKLKPGPRPKTGTTR